MCCALHFSLESWLSAARCSCHLAGARSSSSGGGRHALWLLRALPFCHILPTTPARFLPPGILLCLFIAAAWFCLRQLQPGAAKPPGSVWYCCAGGAKEVYKPQEQPFEDVSSWCGSRAVSARASSGWCRNWRTTHMHLAELDSYWREKWPESSTPVVRKLLRTLTSMLFLVLFLCLTWDVFSFTFASCKLESNLGDFFCARSKHSSTQLGRAHKAFDFDRITSFTVPRVEQVHMFV